MGIGAAWWLLHADSRARRLATLVLMVLVAVASIAVLTPALRAHRAADAFERRLAATDAADVMLGAPDRERPFGLAEAPIPTLRGLPGVLGEQRDVGVFLFFPTVPWMTIEALIAGDASDEPHPAMLAPYDAWAEPGTPNETLVVLSGRLPNPDDPDELFVSPGFATAAGWSVGTHVPVQVGTSAMARADPTGADVSAMLDSIVAQRDMTVVGIGETATAPREGDVDIVVATPALLDEVDVAIQYSVHFVQLAPGTSVSALLDDARAVGLGTFTAEESRHDLLAAYVDSVRPEVVSLIVFAIVTAIVAVLVIGHALGREAALGIADAPTRMALGMTQAQLVVVAGLRVMSIALTGVIAAVPLSVTLADHMPGNTTRAIDRGGIDPFDLLLIGALAMALLALMVGAALPGVMSAARRRRSPERRSWVAERLAAAGAPAPVLVGARHAFESGAGGAQVPVRTAAFVGIVATAVACSAGVFASGLDRLLGEPSNYGLTWDLVLSSSFDPQRDCSDDELETCDSAVVLADRSKQIETFLASDRSVQAYSPVTSATVSIGGAQIPVIGIGPGGVRPIVLSGAEPRDGEVALGQRELADHDLAVGDLVGLPTGESLRIVGTSLVAAGDDGAPTGLGRGGVVTYDTALQLGGVQPEAGFLVRLDDPGEAENVIARFSDQIDIPPDAIGANRQPAPITIEDYRRIHATPLLLALVLMVLATATVALGLASSIRRRAHDFAILRAVGATNRQIVHIIIAQAVVATLFVLAVAVPIGMIVGHATWSALETHLGTRSGDAWPLGWMLAATATGSLVLGIAVIRPSRRLLQLGIAELLTPE